MAKTIRFTPGEIQAGAWGPNPTGEERNALINQAVESSGGRVSTFGGVKQFLFDSGGRIKTFESANVENTVDGYEITLQNTLNGSQVLDEAGLSQDRHDPGTDPYPDEEQQSEPAEDLPSRDSALTPPGAGPTGPNYGEPDATTSNSGVQDAIEDYESGSGSFRDVLQESASSGSEPDSEPTTPDPNTNTPTDSTDESDGFPKIVAVIVAAVAAVAYGVIQ